MSRIFRYILATDIGMAPCPTDDLLTLATCKPSIRRSAIIGDWVIGCLPGRYDRGLIAWAGCIEDIQPVGDYERDYRGRPDAVYRANSKGHFRRLRPDYHDDENQIARDLSGPVLIFDRQKSWYFGDQPQALPEPLMHLAAAGQGHRVNDRRPGDLDQLVHWLEQWRPGSHGKPRDGTLSPQPKPGCG